MNTPSSSYPIRLSSLLALVVVLSGWQPTQTRAAAPDLTINQPLLQSSISFHRMRVKQSDCAVVEGCLTGPGWRNIMRFSVGIANVGDAHLVLGQPADNPDLFEYSPCHGHYHLHDFALYELLSLSGERVLEGRKQAFCLMDISPYAGSTQSSQGFNCSNQGISMGWQDIYDKNLDCQWLDITGIPAGDYLLRVTVNQYGQTISEETNLLNNSVTIRITIPGRIKNR